MSDESPLGRQTGYPDTYAPDLLYAMARSAGRARLGIGETLPFTGVDVWNAWELTWLTGSGLPRAATAEIRVPADSPNIVESKSLKLYLNSFAMSAFETAGEVTRTIAADLGRAAGADVAVELSMPGETDGRRTDVLPGASLDDLDVDCGEADPAPEVLAADPSDTVSESLHTHLLRSLCPVTAQPDTGSLLIEYDGPRIDRAGLLRYVVSFRRHRDFHESCVERIFTDILSACSPARLIVYARYQRRGGIDINPYRASVPGSPANPRLWRQ